MRIRKLAGMLAAVVLGGGLISACGGDGSPNQATSAGPAPQVASVSPTSGPIGTWVTAVGTNFASANNTVKFGTGYIRGIASSDGTTLQFMVPAGLDLCGPDAKGTCPGAFPRVSPGDYGVAVMANGGTSGAVNFTVTP